MRQDIKDVGMRGGNIKKCSVELGGLEKDGIGKRCCIF